MLKPYRYRVSRVVKPPLGTGKRVMRPSTQEVLSGYIQGKKASDLEERTARALDKLEIPYSFRVRVTPLIAGLRQRLTSSLRVIPGEVEIDFLAQGARTYPIFIDGEIAHFKTPYQSEVDNAKTEIVNEFGKMFGWHEAVRVPFTQLIDQPMTDNTIRGVVGL